MRTLGVFLLGLAVGCGGSPPPDDTGDGDEVVTDGDGVTVATTDGEDGPPKPVTITGKSSAEVEVLRFPDETLELHPGDEIQVRLRKTGSTIRGKLSSIRARQLTMIAVGTGILQRFKPGQVESVLFVSREDPNETSVDGDVPLNEDERWLVRFADRDIIGKSARELWTGRFKKNVRLFVATDFKLDGLVFVKRRGSRVYFVPDDMVLDVKPGDQIKLAGTAQGWESKGAEAPKDLGAVYLYLIRRGNRVKHLYTKQRLNPSDITPESLAGYMDKEQVTLTVNRAGSTKFIRIARVKGANAKRYQDYLKKTPDRATINKLRARGDKKLKKEEKRVRRMYEAMGLKDESDLDYAIVVTFRLPQNTEGRLELVTYSKEIGLD
jgi:hypothetical protein